MSKAILLHGGEIYYHGRFIKADVEIRDKKIFAIHNTSAGGAFDEIADCSGTKLVPGFIDIHLHGRGGYDITKGEVSEAAHILPKSGVTSFMPATLTMNFHETLELMSELADYIENQDAESTDSEAVGIYSEGIYFSEAKAGAQNPAYLRKISISEAEQILDAGRGHVKVFAFAPELEGAAEATAYIRSRGVNASMAHSDAEYEDVYRSYLNGLNGVTHIFNAMRPIHHLALGAGGASLCLDGLYAEIITDGMHVMPEMVKVLFRVKPIDKIIMISDNVWISGTPKGNYELSGVPVINEGDKLVLGGTDEYKLAGSCLSLDRGLKNVMNFTGLTAESVLPCLTSNPAAYLGISDRKGSIEAGKDADINILDADYNLLHTYCRGKLYIE